MFLSVFVLFLFLLFRLTSQVACTNWKRIMIVLSESLLQDGVPQRDPMAIPKNLIHNSDMHFTFNKFWKRYGKFARHLMKVGQNTTFCSTW